MLPSFPALPAEGKAGSENGAPPFLSSEKTPEYETASANRSHLPEDVQVQHPPSSAYLVQDHCNGHSCS